MAFRMIVLVVYLFDNKFLVTDDDFSLTVMTIEVCVFCCLSFSEHLELIKLFLCDLLSGSPFWIFKHSMLFLQNPVFGMQ